MQCPFGAEEDHEDDDDEDRDPATLPPILIPERKKEPPWKDTVGATAVVIAELAMDGA